MPHPPRHLSPVTPPLAAPPPVTPPLAAPPPVTPPLAAPPPVTPPLAAPPPVTPSLAAPPECRGSRALRRVRAAPAVAPLSFTGTLGSRHSRQVQQAAPGIPHGGSAGGSETRDVACGEEFKCGIGWVGVSLNDGLGGLA